MRNNPCSTKQAAQLVRRAVRAGYIRRVEPQSLPSESRPYAVMVCLSKCYRVGGLYEWVHIYVSFRRGYKRKSVAIASSTTSNATWKTSAKRGLWNAGYYLNELERTIANHPGGIINPESLAAKAA